jgi:spermidine synthase
MAPHGNRRATVVTRTTFGTVTLHPDPARARGWELLVDGVAQSYVDLGHPTFLHFEYARRLGSVLRLAAPAGVPLTVLHLGGGALTLPRLVSATRPGSSQKVVERDGELVTLVRRELPPAEPLEITVGDARAELETEEPGRYDVIIADVFDGARMPASVASVGFATAAARALRPGGLLTMNLTDVPPLAYSRVQVATLAEAFGDVALIAGGAMFRGRKAGNVILVAAHTRGTIPVRALALDAARDPEPGRVMHGDDLTGFLAGAQARLDEPA